MFGKARPFHISELLHVVHHVTRVCSHDLPDDEMVKRLMLLAAAVSCIVVVVIVVGWKTVSSDRPNATSET